MKFLGFLILNIVLLASIFNWWGASIDRNELGLALMILLITLFSDLREFNFWGLVGRKEYKNLEELEGQKSIVDNPPSVTQKAIERAEQQAPIQLMDTTTGNFLVIAFEIERLLRIASNVLLAGQSTPTNPEKIIRVLQEKGLLTESGVSQIKAIRWLRNILIHGRASEIADVTLNQGIQLSWNFYTDLNNWLKNPS